VLTNQTIDPNQDGKAKPFILLRLLITAWQWLVPPTQAHLDRQSKLARIIAISSFLILCLTLIVLGFVYAKPLQDGFQDWQAEMLYEEARALANDGQIPTAFVKLQKAVSISPDNINALRMNAEFLTLAKRPEALFFLDELEKRGVTKDLDRQLRVQALLNLQRTKEASQLLEGILNDQKPNSELMRLAEAVWGKSQKDSMLTKALKTYADKHPDDRTHSLRLASVQIKSKLNSEVLDGIRHAWKAAEEGKDDISLKALELLASIENLPPEQNRKLIAGLRSHPKANGWHLVAALSRQVAVEPLKKNQLIEEAITLASSRKREDLVPLVNWLIKSPQNEYLKVLSLVSEKEAKSYQPLLENYLTALTYLGRNDDLERLVHDPEVNSIVSQAVGAFFRAHLAYVLKKPAEETRSALLAAETAADTEHQSGLLEQIARYAEERGHYDIAEQAFRAVAINPQSETKGFQGLIRTTAHNGNTDGLIRAAGEAVRRWPDNSSYMESLVYANLLVGREMESSQIEAQKLLDQQPNDHQRKLLMGLAYWRLKDNTNAAQNINNMDLRNLTPGQRAVFAAIARDSNLDNAAEAAHQVLVEIDPKSQMLPEERACFTKASR